MRSTPSRRNATAEQISEGDEEARQKLIMIPENEYFNTIHWTVTVGTNPGFSLEEQKLMDYGSFVEMFQRLCEEEHTESGIWITAVITQTRLAYMHKQGCPYGGEYAYMLTGSCNTEFASVDDYIPALKRVITRLGERLGQVTYTLEIIPAHLDYYYSQRKQQ